MKPFNLEKAKAGNPVCTIRGEPVRIVCFDRKCKNYPILALIDRSGFEVIADYTSSGYFYYSYSEYRSSPNDLMMVE